MKKIKILNVLMIVFLIIGTVGLVANLIFLIVAKDLKIDFNYSGTTLGYITPYISTLLTSLLIKGIYNIQRALSNCLKHNYFNSKSSAHFQKAGIILVVFGLLCLTFHFLNYNFDDKELLLMNCVIYILVLLIGISLTAVADIINKGEIIEQENLLTI